MEQTVNRTVLDQVAVGRLCFFSRPALEPATSSRLDWEEEEARFFRAQRSVVLQLAGFYDRALPWVGDEVASIFAVHAMMAEDEEFVRSVQSMLREMGTTAEYAVQKVWDGYAVSFEAMESPYMQARAADIRDISRRMVRQLMGLVWEDPLWKGPAILVADDLLPSEVMELERRRLLGVVARQGSPDSHAAILLRACHIPVLYGVEAEESWDGRLALMDGRSQRLCLEPDWELLEKFRAPWEEFWSKARLEGGLEPQIG